MMLITEFAIVSINYKNKSLCMYILKLVNVLKELLHDMLSHFFDGLNYSLSVGKLKNNGLLRKKNTKGMIPEGKRNKDG